MWNIVCALLLCAVLVGAQTSVPTVTVTAWIDCQESPENPTQIQYPLQCNNQEVFTRIRLNGSFAFDGAFFNGTVLSGPWTCVGTPDQPVTDTLAPNGACVPVPNGTSLAVTLIRAHWATAMRRVQRTPFGYIQLNYTLATNDSLAYVDGQALNTSSVPDCTGVGAVPMSGQSSCAATLPPSVDDLVVLYSGVCGPNAYAPLLDGALLSDPEFESLNDQSCSIGAVCGACNASGFPTQQTQAVGYQTFAFGICDVYELASEPQLLYDVFVNVTVGGVVRNGAYVSGTYSNGQANIALSARAPTIRVQFENIDAPEQVGMRNIPGYIVVCPDPTINTTRPPGVLGAFNWLYNSSGYMPTFQRNEQIYPPFNAYGPATNQSMQGAWFYLSRDDYETRFSQGVDSQCGLNQWVDSASTAETPTEWFYSNLTAVNVSCPLSAYNASSANSTPFFEQVPLWQGACVPGTDPRFGTQVTPCQITAAMETFRLSYNMDPTVPRNSTAPFMPPGYDLVNPNFFLYQVDQSDVQAAGQTFLMFTPPNFGQGIVALYNITVDVSTDLVPTLTSDTTALVINTAPTSPTLCRFDMTMSTGYFRTQVCNVGLTNIVQVNLTVSDCDPTLVFVGPRGSVNGLTWIVSADNLSATFSPFTLVRAASGVPPCFSTSLLIFNLTQTGYGNIGNVNGAILQACTVTFVANATLSALDPTGANTTTVFTQETTQFCAAANFAPVIKDQSTQQQSLSSWYVAGGIAIAILAVLVTIAVIVVLVYCLFIRKDEDDEEIEYDSVAE